MFFRSFCPGSVVTPKAVTRYRLLISGCGGAGSFVAQVAHLDGRGAIAGLSDPQSKCIENLLGNYPEAITDPDFYSLLDRVKPDAVIVAGPDHLHAEQALAAIDMECHVLIEKPLATKLSDARLIIKAAEKTGVCVMTDHTMRYVHPYGQMAMIAKRGEIGTLFFIQGDYIHDMWSYYSPEGKDHTAWRTDPEHPQNILLGGGCHAIDLILWTVGAPVLEVTCYSNKLSVPEFPDDDCYILIMRFENGVLGKVHVASGCSGHGYGDFLEVYGDQGTLTKGSLIMRGEDPRPIKQDSAQSVVGGHGWGGSVTAFLDVLDGKIKNPISAREGAKTVALCEAAIRSAKLHTSVPVESI